MKNKKRDFSRHNFFFGLILLFGTCIAVFYFLFSSSENGRLICVLDDAYIHLKFARNLVSGNGYSFNPGVWVPGSTSPLWVFWLALLSFFYADFEIIALVSGFLFYLLSGLLLYYALIKAGFSRLEACFSGLFCLLTGPYCWVSFSGMETSLFALAVLGIPCIIILGFARPGWVSSLYLILLLWLRPEGGLFGFLFWLRFYLWDFFQKKIVLKDFIIWNLVITIGFFPYFLGNLLMVGHLFPNTYYAKIAGHKIFALSPAKDYYLSVMWMMFEWNPIFFLAAIFSIFYLYREKLLICYLLFFLLPIFQAFYFPWNDQAGRYLLPLVPLIYFLGAFSLHWWIKYPLSGGLSSGRKNRYLLLLLPFIFYAFYWNINWARTFSLSTKNILKMHFNMAAWVDKNILPAETIALGDIGIISFFCRNHIIDINGLISPEIVESRGRLPFEIAIFKNFLKKRPGFVIALQSWFPFFRNFKGFEQVYQVRVPLEDNVVLGGNLMVVYRIDYSPGPGTWVTYYKKSSFFKKSSGKRDAGDS
ncbi:hypothetical protein ACFL35_00375 [Candidatus Riflebacteria bacterium]